MIDVATAMLLAALAWAGYNAEWVCHPIDSGVVVECGIQFR